MAGIFSNFFEPSEIKEVRRNVKEFILAQAPLSSTLVLPSALELVENKRAALLADIANGTMTAQTTAYVVAGTALAVQLGSGQHHTYRGVLSFMGDDMLKAFNASVKALQDTGYYSGEQAQDMTDWVQEKIKSVG